MLQIDQEKLGLMTWGEYMRHVIGYRIREDNKWRHTRLIIGALTHTDPRRIIELPGDYPYVPKTKEQVKERLRQLGVDWEVN